MPTLYFSTSACHASELIDADNEQLETFSRINHIGPGYRLFQGQAYTLDLDSPNSASIVRIINQLSFHERTWLMNAVELEGEELHREAEFWERYLSEESLSKALSLVGASQPAIRARYEQLSRFHQALVKYENALIALQNPVPHSMPGAGPRGHWEAVARRDATQAFDALVSEHRTAMNQLSPVMMRTRNRGGAINNANRGITLALRSRGRRVDPRIQVSDLFQAHRLKQFTHAASRLAGPLALGTDAALRSGHVKAVSDADGNWHRESARQMGGFALGAVGGAIAASLTGFALGGKATAAGLLAAGPLGWAILGCMVVVVAYASYKAAKATGSSGEALGGLAYDYVFPAL